VLLRIIALAQILVETWTLAATSTLVWTDSLLAALPLIHIIVLTLAETSLGSAVLLVISNVGVDIIVIVFLGSIFNILELLAVATVHLLLMAALHVCEAGIQVAGILGSFVADQHGHVRVPSRRHQLLFLASVGARQILVIVDVRTVI